MVHDRLGIYNVRPSQFKFLIGLKLGGIVIHLLDQGVVTPKSFNKVFLPQIRCLYLVEPIKISEHLNRLKTSVLPAAETSGEPNFEYLTPLSDVGACIETCLRDVSAPVLALLCYLLHDDCDLPALPFACLILTQGAAFFQLLLQGSHTIPFWEFLDPYHQIFDRI